MVAYDVYSTQTTHTIAVSWPNRQEKPTPGSASIRPTDDPGPKRPSPYKVFDAPHRPTLVNLPSQGSGIPPTPSPIFFCHLMAPIKRSRRHNHADIQDGPPPIVTRRATRHTPNPAPVQPSTTEPAAKPVPAQSQLPPAREIPAPKNRRGRPPASAASSRTASTMATATAAPKPPNPTAAGTQRLTGPIRYAQTTLKWAAVPRSESIETKTAKDNVIKGVQATNGSTTMSKENMMPTQNAANEAAAATQRNAAPLSTARTTKPQAPKQAPQQLPSPPIAEKQTVEPPKKTASPAAERNIDKIVLGNICFKTWYPSFYGKEVLGEPSSRSEAAAPGNKNHPRRERDPSPILDRLYVCPSCFKYSKELVMWLEHVRVCEVKEFVPGRKIYTHPKNSGRPALVPVETNVKGGVKRRRGDAAAAPVPQAVQDDGEWSIWEVDGEKDVVGSSRTHPNRKPGAWLTWFCSSFAKTFRSLQSSSLITSPSFLT